MTESRLKKGSLGLAMISNMISVVVSALVSLVISKYLIETSGSVTYSYYPIATNFANYFSVIFIAVNAMSSRFVMVSLLEGKDREAREYYSSVFFADLMLSVLLSAVLAAFVFNIDHILNIPPGIVSEVKQLFVWILMMVVVNGLATVFSISIYARNRMDIKALIDLIISLSKLACFLFFMYTGKLTIVSYGFLLFLSSMIHLVLEVIATRILLPDFHFDLHLFSFPKIRNLTKSGFWVMVNQLGLMLINNAQLIIANIFLGPDASAPLSLVQPLFQFGSLFFYAIETVLQPLIVKILISREGDVSARMLYLQEIVAVFVIIPCTLLMGFGGSFFRLWLPHEDHTVLYVLSWLNMSQLLWTYMSTVYTSSMTALNKVKVPSIALVTLGCFSFFLIFLSLRFTDLGIIGILLANNFTYILYYAGFLPRYAGKQMDGIHTHLSVLVIMAVLFVAVNTIAGRVLIPGGYISLFGYCLVLEALGCGAVLLLARTHPKELIRFFAER
ncbi:MAG: oligosaccharide flippase family protein [Solobacterium sp.]|nr:oligosaccharide flippase family protein [Solobacterium sp.]